MTHHEAVIELSIQELLQEKDYFECQSQPNKDHIRKLKLQIEQLYRELREQKGRHHEHRQAINNKNTA